MRLLLAALVAAIALGCLSARADIVIRDDPGGELGRYVQKYTDAAYRGDRIRIAGDCNSACTLLTGLVPPERVCAAPSARLGFHSASWGAGGPFSAPGTALMWRIYPERVRALIRRRGWDGQSAHPDLIFISGEALFRRC